MTKTKALLAEKAAIPENLFSGILKSRFSVSLKSFYQ
jgi:hypothetical protein